MMEKTKHTPGPWHTDPAKSFYVFAHGSLAEQSGVNNGPFVCNASTQANSRLIAAAPELLQALLHVMPHVGTNYSGKQRYDILEPARAAIAKARGE